jgi:S1-C subfamily serine protease
VHGKYVRPSLDIETDAGVNALLSSQLGVHGVFVLGATGAAAAAGLRPARISRRGTVTPGDVIVAVQGKPVPTVARLEARLDDFTPSVRVRLDVLRDGKHVPAEIKLTAAR